MHLFKLVRTASREANALAAVAAAALILKIFLLNRFPAPFFGVNELGIITEAVLASVVASYVFYLLVVHVKEYSDRKIIGPYIEKHSKRVVGDCISQISEIAKKSGVVLEFTALTETDISSAFSTIQPYSQAPLLLSAQSHQYANWIQYFIHHENRSRGSIRKLFDQLPFLDVTLVSILTAIDDCSHFSGMNLLLNVPVGNPNLSVWAKSFYEYCLLCRQLHSHLVRTGFSSVTP